MILNQFKGRSGIFLLRTLQGSAKNAFLCIFSLQAGVLPGWAHSQFSSSFGTTTTAEETDPVRRDRGLARDHPWGHAPSKGVQEGQPPGQDHEALLHAGDGGGPDQGSLAAAGAMLLGQPQGPLRLCQVNVSALWGCPSNNRCQQGSGRQKQQLQHELEQVWSLSQFYLLFILYSDWHMACPLDIFLANQG